MSTVTTLKLPDDLKARIEPLAAVEGKTAHAWMIDALRSQASLAEMRRSFIKEALDSAAEVDAGGPLYSMEDVHAYLRARVAGQAVKRPRPLKKGARRGRRA